MATINCLWYMNVSICSQRTHVISCYIMVVKVMIFNIYFIISVQQIKDIQPVPQLCLRLFCIPLAKSPVVTVIVHANKNISVSTVSKCCTSLLKQAFPLQQQLCLLVDVYTTCLMCLCILHLCWTINYIAISFFLFLPSISLA